MWGVLGKKLRVYAKDDAPAMAAATSFLHRKASENLALIA
jgi:hypothetical protein